MGRAVAVVAGGWYGLAGASCAELAGQLGEGDDRGAEGEARGDPE